MLQYPLIMIFAAMILFQNKNLQNEIVLKQLIHSCFKTIYRKIKALRIGWTTIILRLHSVYANLLQHESTEIAVAVEATFTGKSSDESCYSVKVV